MTIQEVTESELADRINELSTAFEALKRTPGISFNGMEPDMIEIQVPFRIWDKITGKSLVVDECIPEYRVYKAISDSVLVYTIADSFRKLHKDAA